MVASPEVPRNAGRSRGAKRRAARRTERHKHAAPGQYKGRSPVGPRPVVVDRNICHFVWYGGVAGEGLRSVGEEALPSSKSVCSILPIARLFYRTGLDSRPSAKGERRASPTMLEVRLGGRRVRRLRSPVRGDGRAVPPRRRRVGRLHGLAWGFQPRLPAVWVRVANRKRSRPVLTPRRCLASSNRSGAE